MAAPQRPAIVLAIPVGTIAMLMGIAGCIGGCDPGTQTAPPPTDIANRSDERNDSKAGTRSTKPATPTKTTGDTSNFPSHNVDGLIISKATTYVDGPLREDGSIDYPAAFDNLCREGVTKDNNAAIAFFKAYGPRMIDDDFVKIYYDAFDMEPLPEEGDYFVSLEDFASRDASPDDMKPDDDGTPIIVQKMRDVCYDLNGKPWSARDHPRVAAWLKENERVMPKLEAAIKLPRWFWPSGWARDRQPKQSQHLAIQGNLIDDLRATRYVARAFAVRSTLRLNSGDQHGAWSDIMVLYRLAMLLRQRPIVMAQLTAASIDHLAHDAARAFARHAGLTSIEADDCTKAIASLPAHAHMGILELEDRFIALDMVFAFRDADRGLKLLREQLKEDGGTPTKFMLLFEIHDLIKRDFDINIALRRLNTVTDEYIQAVDLSNPRTVLANRAAIQSRIEKMGKAVADSFFGAGVAKWAEAKSWPQDQRRTFASEQVGDLIFNFYLRWQFKTYPYVRLRYDTDRTLTNLAFSLEGYRAGNGRYPDKLDDLVPAYVKSLPVDLFTGDPLKYRRTEKGYILYSVDLDGKDNGGDETGETSDEGKEWDNVIRVP